MPGALASAAAHYSVPPPASLFLGIGVSISYHHHVNGFLKSRPYPPSLKQCCTSTLTISKCSKIEDEQRIISTREEIIPNRLFTSTAEMVGANDVIIPRTENVAIIVAASVVGLFTGVTVVLFNLGIHEIRDLFWDGISYRGASWLREESIQNVWPRVILVPFCGGLVVTLLNLLRNAIMDSNIQNFGLASLSEPILKVAAACVTLGTGNSLGPEGPSVEIGASVAKGVGALLDKSSAIELSLRAAGSAAGIASGFNAAVAGCFFAVESVLWPSPTESFSSLTNTTSMVILSAVIASVVAEIGLGSEPAFTVPDYDFRSPSELPLYLFLGVVCGLVSLAFSRCTTFMVLSLDKVEKTVGISRISFPMLGGLAVGVISLAYPEILYWGFENVDILLEAHPFVKGLSADLLLQLVGVKIIATSFCRACGLVGGYYAPSLFIGAATGMAYGKIISLVISESNSILHLSGLEVAAPQAYGLVGMAATLAGVCQVPLTAVLLLFELTQDYRIVLPLLGAVGLSAWITSGQARRVVEVTKGQKGYGYSTGQTEMASISSSSPDNVEKSLDESVLCEIESSLCLDELDDCLDDIAERILVSQAMRTQCTTVLMRTTLTEAVSLMLSEKQSCALIVDDEGFLVGLLTLSKIQQFSTKATAKVANSLGLTVSEVCAPGAEDCRVPFAVTPDISLSSAQTLMQRHGVSHLPVILELVKNRWGKPVGLLDKECINLTCRALAIGERLESFSATGLLEN